jgi:hypothetical protein
MILMFLEMFKTAWTPSALDLSVYEIVSMRDAKDLCVNTITQPYLYNKK